MAERGEKYVTIGEDFSHPQGGLFNYDAYSLDERQAVLDQRHKDIRSFVQEDTVVGSTILVLNQFNMADLNTRDVGDLGEGNLVTRRGEGWSGPSHTNLITNPSFEVDTTGWSSWATTVTTFARETGWSSSGAASLRFTATKATAGSEWAIVYSPQVAATAGETFSAALELNALSVPATYGYISLQIMWMDDANAQLGSNTVSVIAPGTTRLTLSSTAPAGTTKAELRVFSKVENGEVVDFYIDSVILLRGANLTSYFDGDTPGAYWTGTAHASTSVFATNATVQTDRRNWRGLRMPLTTGLNVATSVIPQDFGKSADAGPFPAEAVNIQEGFDDTDYISIALPDFPLGVVDLAASTIDFTSHPEGDFTTGPTVSIPFSSSTLSLVAGDSELRFARSLLGTLVDLSAITGVRFQIQATGSGTFRAMAIRLLDQNWKYLPADIDTRYDRLVSTVAPNGSITRTFDANWPATLWRASDPPGAADPRPVDGRLVAKFNTGSLDNTNNLRLYVREVAGADFLSQLELNGITQANLNGKDQPTVGEGKWIARTQADLSLSDQEDLLSDPQYELERLPDPISASYIVLTFQWDANAILTVTISNSESEGITTSTYTMNKTGLTPNTDYAAIIDFEENTLHARVYPVDSSGAISDDTIFFDTGGIVDDTAFKRWPGRVGWGTTLQDGDSYIESIEPAGLSYGEYRSAPFESVTPVEGARLFVEASSPVELFTGVEPGPFGGIVVPDVVKSISGRSFKVTAPAGAALQGVQTNAVEFDNFSDYDIRFDLNFPSDAIEAGAELEAYLLGENYQTLSLTMGKLRGDQWYTIHLNPSEIKLASPGQYRLVLLQSGGSEETSWWIDNISIKKRAFRWSGRADEGDPWNDDPGVWTDFRFLLNSQSDGVVFADRGNTLQIRGQATHQKTLLTRLSFEPKYAQLGRLVWEDEEPEGQAPTAYFTWSALGNRTIAFDGSSSNDDRSIIAYQWSFGDGTINYGSNAKHQYPAVGTYNVTLTVTDDQGFQHSNTQVVSFAS